MNTNQTLPRPLVHLELHTADQVRASAFYARLLQWRPEFIRAACGSYLALDTGASVGAGIAECGTLRPLWLPYFEIDSIQDATERAAGSARPCCSSRGRDRRAGAASSLAGKPDSSRCGSRSDERRA